MDVCGVVNNFNIEKKYDTRIKVGSFEISKLFETLDKE